MPSYKLFYFDGKGRVEAIRMAFAVGVLQYEDVRVQLQEWPALKPSEYVLYLYSAEVGSPTFGFSISCILAVIHSYI